MKLGKNILKRFLSKNKKSRSKKGGVIFLIDLLVICIFPLIMVQIIDTGNIYYIDKHLKSSLDLAVKSASLYEDENINPGIPNGQFYIDNTKANNNFTTIFNLNYHSVVPVQSNTSAKPAIVETQKKVFVYNNFPGSLVDFPVSGSMSTTTLGFNLLGRYPEFQIKVKRPTVLGVARVKYRTFYGKELDILKYSSSQMSNKNN